jgi:two-component system, NtrC family, sensor kinase
MTPQLQTILDLIKPSQLSDADKAMIEKALKDVDKALEISNFKLDRTEKVKRTTAILLEETIQELEMKRKAVEESKDALQKSLEELKAAQAQLIQSEKMASLGELTAGIAHEIQNPLNFVNNFSSLNTELVAEVQEAISRSDLGDAEDILRTIADNEQKILQHGKRADSIVKGMLQHSRSSSGVKELTDINSLCEEYLRLAYHGYRAKDKNFNAKSETDFDDSIGKINTMPQDIGRVVLNLINNAFYAVNEKSKSESTKPGFGYQPKISVSTKRIGDKVVISVSDNGNGIPAVIRDKIFQPFFTTKPTGQGTGLGLSLSYDIVKSQGGKLDVETKEGEGTTFSVTIPV